MERFIHVAEQIVRLGFLWFAVVGIIGLILAGVLLVIGISMMIIGLRGPASAKRGVVLVVLAVMVGVGSVPMLAAAALSGLLMP